MFGLLTAIGLLTACKYINPNIRFFSQLFFKGYYLLAYEPLFTLIILIPLAIILDSNLRIGKTYRYTFWIVLAIEYLLYIL